MHPGCHFGSQILLVMVFELDVSWVKSRDLWLEGGHVVHLRSAHRRCVPTGLSASYKLNAMRYTGAGVTCSTVVWFDLMRVC
eukprot:361868-Chlamydomonas_euryale.AAC.1